MKIAPLLQRRDAYLCATFSGDGTVAECLDMMQLVRHATIEFADTALLLDLRLLQDSFRPDDEAKLGLHLAKAFAHLRKVASLVRPARRTGISARAAGAFPLQVFESEDEAIAWLLE